MSDDRDVTNRGGDMAAEARVEYLIGRGVADADLDEAERAELDAILLALGDAAAWELPPDGLADLVVESIRAEVEAAGPVPTPAAAVVPIERARSRRALAWIGGAVIGAAAASLVAIAVTRDDAPATATPDAVIRLAGTDLAPTSSGSAEITSTASGLEIVLEVPGLPRRDGDEFYEGWLKSVDGTRLVPIGTFHEADHVVLWAGVSLDDYPILTVTRETATGPTDPAQGSSGEVVVKGQVEP